MSGTQFRRGEIWLADFQFSHSNITKKRPVLILSKNIDLKNENDILVCQITTKIRNGKYSVTLDTFDLKSGKIPMQSEIRCNKIKVIEKNSFFHKFSELKIEKYDECRKNIIELIS